MKQIEWINGNHMRFGSLNKTFNRKVDCISTGNVVGEVQYSGYIRSFTETECNGFTNPPGHLQEFDLEPFKSLLSNDILDIVREKGKTEKGVLYVFFHWRGEHRIIHGAVLTTHNYEHPKLIQKWYLKDTLKSQSVIDEAVKYIAEEV